MGVAQPRLEVPSTHHYGCAQFGEEAHRVTISALANSMAMVRASFPSASTALMSAPRFRKRHARLQWGRGGTRVVRGHIDGEGGGNGVGI